jgi:hypothetical protein
MARPKQTKGRRKPPSKAQEAKHYRRFLASLSLTAI